MANDTNINELLGIIDGVDDLILIDAEAPQVLSPV